MDGLGTNSRLIFMKKDYGHFKYFYTNTRFYFGDKPWVLDNENIGNYKRKLWMLDKF